MTSIPFGEVAVYLFHELLEGADYDVSRAYGGERRLIVLLRLRLPSLRAFHLDGEEAVMAVFHQQHQVGKPGTHAHRLEYAALGLGTPSAVCGVEQQQPQLRILQVEPPHALNLQPVLLVSPLPPHSSSSSFLFHLASSILSRRLRS